MSTALLEIDQERQQGGIFDYISPSRLNLWLKCPLAFRFRYVDRVEQRTTPNLFIGKRVHDGLAVAYRHRQLGITLRSDEVVQRMFDAWDEAVEADKMSFDSAAGEHATRQKASDLVAAYLSRVPADEPKPIAVETSMEVPLVDPFSGEDLGIPLVGIVDLVLGGESGPVIIDFKTAARSGRPTETAHEIQLGCYSHLFRELTGESEAGLEIRSLVKTKTPQIEFHPYPARRNAHFRRLFAVIKTYLDDLHSDRFIFRPGFGCSMCDHRDGRCQSWCP